MTATGLEKNIGLSAEQISFRTEVAEFVDSQIMPDIEGYEEAGEYPLPLVRQAAARGYLGAITPVQSGGRGIDFTSYGILIEELARGDRVTASLVHVQNSLINACLNRFGSDEQRAKYQAGLARGELLSAACFTEPDVGSDLAGVQLHAKRDGDEYVLNGEKVYISHAGVADLLFVLATVDPELRAKGTVALLVDTATPGVDITPIAMRTMRRGSICSVRFDGARVPASQRVGDEGGGLRVSLSNLNMGRYSVAAQALGQAQAALDAALQWATTRRQFGTEIGRMQAIQQKLADMIVSVDAARMLVYRVGTVLDSGSDAIAPQAAAAKLFASETATRVALDAIQILGARGLSEAFAVSRIPLEAKVLEIAEGSNQIQRMIIAEHALGWRR